MRRLVLFAALLLSACGKPPKPPPPPSIPAPPLPALPDIKPSEDFVRDEHLQLTAGEPVPFGWDLREGVTHTYLYRQESNMILAASGAGQEGKLTYRTQWKGAVKIDGGGKLGDAWVFYTPIAQWINGEPISSEELNKLERTEAWLQVTADGRFPSRRFDRGKEDPKLDLFFAFPTRDLKEGERETREIHLKDPGVDTQFHGKQEILNAGRRKIGRNECIKLLSTVDLEVIPPGRTGDARGRLVGAIAAYYDPKERRFINVDASLAMAVDSRYEAKPADPKMARFWQLNRVQADMRVTIAFDGS